MSRLTKTSRIIIDIIIFIFVCFLDFSLHKWAKQQIRGFHCNDLSLKYPFRQNSISLIAVVVIVIIPPCLIIICVESFKAINPNITKRTIQRLKNMYEQLGYYLFGLGMCLVATDIAKVSVGRLRPNFFDVCVPEMPDGTTCADPINHDRYILEYTCTGSLATPKLAHEIKRSFPSGHSSLIFFACIYICFYIQATLSTRFTKLMKHLIQFVIMMFAFYVALTRIADYWHHWSDVLSGSLIGIFFAFYTALHIADLFKRHRIALIKASERLSNATIHTIKSVTSTAAGTPAGVSHTHTTKSGQTVLPAYTFGTIPYAHTGHHAYNGHYQNYGYVP